MHATDIVAYTYQAETLCPSCTLDALNVPASLRQEQDHQSIIETLAVAQDIDWGDERSFDSGDFPKVVFADQIEWEELDVPDGSFIGQGFRAERCNSCGEELV